MIEYHRVWDSLTLPNFQDKYYEYGEEGIEMKVLTIRCYESDSEEYLVAYYLFEVVNNQSKDIMLRGVYR